MTELVLSIEGAAELGLGIGGDPELALGIERGGGSGTSNYEGLTNKPKIEGHTLVGDSTLRQIGVGDVTPQDIDRIIFG